MDGLLLQSVEGLGEPSPEPSPCDIWESLETERECLADEILSKGPLFHSELDGMQESEASEEYARAVEWRQRGLLEMRLREISEAQDRLTDGTYGRCTNCSAEIDWRRLAADPAAAFCIICQKSTEPEVEFYTM